VVGRDEIGVSTLRPLSSQGEHPRPEGGERTWRRLCRLRGSIDTGSLVHLVQVAAHGPERLLVVVATDLLNKAAVAHAQPEAGTRSG
jgi:hypothetical protein